MSNHEYGFHPVDAPAFDLAQWMWCAKWCEQKGLSPYDAEVWAKAKEEYLKVQEKGDE